MSDDDSDTMAAPPENALIAIIRKRDMKPDSVDHDFGARAEEIRQQDLQSVTPNDKFSDQEVIFHAGMNPKIYKLHRAIICPQSTYFNDWLVRLLENNRPDQPCSIPENPETFDRVIGWLYKAKGATVEDSLRVMRQLLSAADELGIAALKLQVLTTAASPSYYQRFPGPDIEEAISFLNKAYVSFKEKNCKRSRQSLAKLCVKLLNGMSGGQIIDLTQRPKLSDEFMKQIRYAMCNANISFRESSERPYQGGWQIIEDY
ncbi:hypothetical protein TWF730_003639 [Orbilia blumenaviensis]|uniref:BTB domain-containing protein n=1 Tax=Orbilia blumenaviensis TaxID=1796055 RepID=A0AAV9U2Z0_9PEZI